MKTGILIAKINQNIHLLLIDGSYIRAIWSIDLITCCIFGAWGVQYISNSQLANLDSIIRRHRLRSWLATIFRGHRALHFERNSRQFGGRKAHARYVTAKRDGFPPTRWPASWIPSCTQWRTYVRTHTSAHAHPRTHRGRQHPRLRDRNCNIPAIGTQ